MNESTLLAVRRLAFGTWKMHSAHEIPTYIFVGIVTVDGEPALPGTEVRAIVDGKAKGFVHVHELGVYGPLYVEGLPSDRQITFRVGNYVANQTVPGNHRRAIILDLTVHTNRGWELESN
jgi:hypothetical protein